MAQAHAEAYADLPNVALVAAVDPSVERRDAFSDRFNIEHGFDNVEDLVEWGKFDAASNVTPDALHCRTTLPLLTAGKHVLCEKPLALTTEDADLMAQEATAADVVNMVNLTYRNVPAVIEAAAMVRDGAIGTVRHFEASYLQSWLTQPAWGDWQTEQQWLWRLSSAHGSLGVLGDVGVHILDMATHVAGAAPRDVSCRLTTFDKAPGGRIGEYVLDANDSFNMHVELLNGAVGVVHASRMASGHHNDLRLRIYGSTGGLEVRWEKNESILRACVGTDMAEPNWTAIAAPDVKTNYVRFVDAIAQRQKVLPDFAHGAVLQHALTAAVASDAAQGAIQPV